MSIKEFNFSYSLKHKCIGFMIFFFNFFFYDDVFLSSGIGLKVPYPSSVLNVFPNQNNEFISDPTIQRSFLKPQ